MKHFFFALMLLLPVVSWADPWDNLTLDEAKGVVAFLKAEPYILDYCDCCDAEGPYATKLMLMEVVSTEIVTCDWDNTKYSVVAQVEILAEISYTNDGPDITQTVIMDGHPDQLTITMNYTWAFHDETAKAAPFYTAVPYDSYGEQPLDKGVCREFVGYPAPEYVHNNKYASWWKAKNQ